MGGVFNGRGELVAVLPVSHKEPPPSGTGPAWDVPPVAGQGVHFVRAEGAPEDRLKAPWGGRSGTVEGMRHTAPHC